MSSPTISAELRRNVQNLLPDGCAWFVLRKLMCMPEYISVIVHAAAQCATFLQEFSSVGNGGECFWRWVKTEYGLTTIQRHADVPSFDEFGLMDRGGIGIPDWIEPDAAKANEQNGNAHRCALFC